MKYDVKNGGGSALVPTCGIRTAVVLFGGFLLHLTIGSTYTFGNFSPYFMSYLRNRTQDTDISNIDGIWIGGVGTFGNIFGMVAGGFLDGRFGPRVATLVGSLIFSAAVLVTYFAVQIRFAVMTVTYGLLFSFGGKIVYGVPLQTAMKWLPKHPTLAVGLILAGYGGGATIFNQLITAYINPDNLSPDFVDDDGERYFTDKGLLDRVPTCFLLLAASYLVLQLIGVVCLSDPPPPAVYNEEGGVKLESKHDLDSDTKAIWSVSQQEYLDTSDKSAIPDKPGVQGKTSNGIASTDVINKTANGFPASSDVTFKTTNGVPASTDVKTQTANGITVSQAKDNSDALRSTDKAVEVQYGRRDSLESSDVTRLDGKDDMTHKEAILMAFRTRSFYIVWFTVLFVPTGMMWVGIFYKAFGQTFIHDDHFLALVGSMASICNCIGRPMWGAFMDRFGFKVTMRCINGGLVVLYATLQFTEHMPSWLFLCWICAIYLFYCGNWAVIPSTMAKLFGVNHMATNYALVQAAFAISSLAGSAVASVLKPEVGWHGMFYLSSSLVAIPFLLTFVFNGVDRQGISI